MGKSIMRLTLDLWRRDVQASISVSRGDTNRRLVVTLMENGKPYAIPPRGYAVFSAVKPDGTSLYNDCVIMGNSIIYDLTEQTVVAVGAYEAQIIVYGPDGGSLATPKVLVVVHEAIYGSDVESTTEAKALEAAAERFETEVGYDEELETEDKTLHGAINEVNAGVEEAKKAIEEVRELTEQLQGVKIEETDEGVWVRVVDSEGTAIEEKFVPRNGIIYANTLIPIMSGASTTRVKLYIPYEAALIDLYPTSDTGELTLVDSIYGVIKSVSYDKELEQLVIESTAEDLDKDRFNVPIYIVVRPMTRIELETEMGGSTGTIEFPRFPCYYHGYATLEAVKGKDGADGKSAYEIACDNGFEGSETEWLDSLKGSAETPACIVAEAERVAGLVQASRTARTLVLTAMSDFHVYDGNNEGAHPSTLASAQYAAMGVAELQKRMHIDGNLFLGDFTYGSNIHTADQVFRDINTVKKILSGCEAASTDIWCVGNHDLNYYNVDRLLTEDEQYAYIGANAEGVKSYANLKRCYGYYDFEPQRIRVIYLNTCDILDWKTLAWGDTLTAGTKAPRAEWISPTQIQWLADTALNFSDKTDPGEWGIVIVGHHPLHYSSSCYDNCMRLLEAYRAGGAGTLSCTIYTTGSGDAIQYFNQTVTYDFSSAPRAEIICNIHGHNHNCGHSQISSDTRTGGTNVAPWLWRFCASHICADRYNSGTTVGTLYGEYDENGDPVSHTKEVGTAKATSFNVFSIDREHKVIRAHIFGAGKDREESYGNMCKVTSNLTNCSSSNTDKWVAKGDAYSATITADENCVLDSVTVTMNGETITVTDGNIVIENVTGDIVITAVAEAKTTEAVKKYSVEYNLTNCSSSNTEEEVEEGAAYSATLAPDSGYVLDTVTVTMGSEDITSEAYSGGAVSIASVTGDVVITATATVEETEPTSYTNQIPVSTDAAGNIYNKVGYADGVRISSSNGAEKTGAPTDVTGFILCDYGEVLRFANCQILNDTTSNYQFVSCYTSDKTYIATVNLTTAGSDIVTVDSNGYITEVRTIKFEESTYGGMKYVRITGNYIGADSIITVNEEIT